MSIVAAMKIGGRIIMSADSYLNHGHGLKSFDSEKIFRIKNNTDKDEDVFLLGSVGSVRDKYCFLDFIEQRNDSPNPPLDSRQKIFQLFSEFRKWKAEHHIDPFESHTGFLLACAGGLFYYGGDSELESQPEYAAIGAGDLVATALMYEGYLPGDAVRVCRKVVNNCGGKITTYDIKYHKKDSG